MSLFILPLIPLAFTSCSSHKPLIDESKKDQNVYFQFYEAQNPELKKKIQPSAFNLFRASLDPFLDDLSKVKESQRLLNSLPWTVVHGDFHVQQMAYLNGQAGLDDFDTVGFAPVWLDLVRMETSALIVAKSQSLSDFEPGACVRSYVARLSGANHPNLGKPYPLAVAYDSNSPHHASDQKGWREASTVVNNDIKTILREYVDKSLPKEKIKEMRKLADGLGSFGVDKYLVLMESDALFEFKEQLESPLKSFRDIEMRETANKAQGSLSSKACTRFMEGANLFRPSGNWDCLATSSKSFARITWTASYESPGPENFKDTATLNDHISWMCSSLAAAETKNLKPDEIVVIANTLQRNAVYMTKILRLAQVEANRIDLAYRLILNDTASK